MSKRLVVAVSLAAVGLVAFTAHAATPLTPNLKALPASDIRLQQTTDGRTLLRFSTTGWNSGQGPLELRAGTIDRDAGRQNVMQRIYNSDGTFVDVLAGQYVWHEAHNHFHFEDYATYTLQPIDAPGASERYGQKTTFCVMDTSRINTKLPGAPKKAYYSTCGNTVQGMSVGWGDTYGYQLAGQEIDVTDMPNGVYRLQIVLDPKNKLVEGDDADNTSLVDIRLADGTVSVLGSTGPGRGNR